MPLSETREAPFIYRIFQGAEPVRLIVKLVDEPLQIELVPEIEPLRLPIVITAFPDKLAADA